MWQFQIMTFQNLLYGKAKHNKSKTVALWGKLAERYKDKEWIGGYDLLNEVNWPLGTNVLRDLYVRITNEIRAVDSNHILFIEGNGFANDFYWFNASMGFKHGLQST